MNVQIKEPTVCGITSLGMDHTEILGVYVLYFLSFFLLFCIWFDQKEIKMYLLWQS